MWGRAGKPGAELSNGEEEDDVGDWHSVQQRQSRGRPLLYAACTGITSIRNAYSCLTGVVSHGLGNISGVSNELVGQWFVDECTTDAVGHHGYATGYVACWSPTAHPIGLFAQQDDDNTIWNYDGYDGDNVLGNTREHRSAEFLSSGACWQMGLLSHEEGIGEQGKRPPR